MLETQETQTPDYQNFTDMDWGMKAMDARVSVDEYKKQVLGEGYVPPVEKPEAETTDSDTTEQTTEQTEQQEQKPALDFAKYSDRFKSQQELDDMIASIEARKDYDDIKKQHEALLAHNKELLKYKDENPYSIGDERLYKISMLGKETGIKDISLLASIADANMDSLSDKDALRIQAKLDDSELTDEHFERSFSRKYSAKLPKEYKDKEDFDLNATDGEKEDYLFEAKEAERQLRVDAKRAKGDLSKFSEKIKLPERKTQEQVQQEVQQTVAKWSEPFNKMVGEFTKVEVEIPTGLDKETVVLEVPVTDEQKKVLSEALSRYIVLNNLQPDEKTVKELSQYLQQAYMASNTKYVASQVALEVAKAKDRFFFEQKTNPTKKTTTTKAPVEHQMSDEQKEMARLDAEIKAGKTR